MTTTVDAMVERIKRRITVPANQVLLSDDNLLVMANDVVRERIIPLMMSVNQNYFVVRTEIPLVADQSEYSIPVRAIGRGLRDLKMQRGDDVNAISNMSLVALEDSHLFGEGASPPVYFYFRGDKIVLVPVPIVADYTMLVWYNLQPSQFILTTDAARVASISGAIVTCDNVPSELMAGVDIDFIEGKQGCSILGMDVEITNVAGNQITFASADDVPTNLAAGDYISVAGTTPVVQLPDEAIPLVECWTGERVCYAIGDFDGANLLAQRSTETANNLKVILEPRIEGAQTKIVNRRGLLRGQGFTSWRYRGGYVL